MYIPLSFSFGYPRVINSVPTSKSECGMWLVAEVFIQSLIFKANALVYCSIEYFLISGCNDMGTWYQLVKAAKQYDENFTYIWQYLIYLCRYVTYLALTGNIYVYWISMNFSLIKPGSHGWIHYNFCHQKFGFAKWALISYIYSHISCFYLFGTKNISRSYWSDRPLTYWRSYAFAPRTQSS